MANVELTKIEERLNRKLLYNVRIQRSEGRIEFPIGIQEYGSASLDEAAVLRATLIFAEELATSLRLKLEPVADRS
jgi:hypothetical protein